MPPIPPIPPPSAPASDARLRQVATELEASFLEVMLEQAGFGETRESFGGGAGEEGFASFLRHEHAMALARKGGIGLAEHIFHSLKARTDVEQP